MEIMEGGHYQESLTSGQLLGASLGLGRSIGNENEKRPTSRGKQEGGGLILPYRSCYDQNGFLKRISVGTTDIEGT